MDGELYGRSKTFPLFKVFCRKRNIYLNNTYFSIWILKQEFLTFNLREIVSFTPNYLFILIKKIKNLFIKEKNYQYVWNI